MIRYSIDNSGCCTRCGYNIGTATSETCCTSSDTFTSNSYPDESYKDTIKQIPWKQVSSTMMKYRINSSWLIDVDPIIYKTNNIKYVYIKRRYNRKLMFCKSGYLPSRIRYAKKSK